MAASFSPFKLLIVQCPFSNVISPWARKSMMVRLTCTVDNPVASPISPCVSGKLPGRSARPAVGAGAGLPRS